MLPKSIWKKLCAFVRRHFKLIITGLVVLVIFSVLLGGYLILIRNGSRTCETLEEEVEEFVAFEAEVNSLKLDARTPDPSPLPSLILPMTIYLTPGWSLSAASDRSGRLQDVITRVKKAFQHPSLVSKIVIKEKYSYLSSMALEPTSEGMKSLNSSLSHIKVSKGHLHLALTGTYQRSWIETIYYSLGIGYCPKIASGGLTSGMSNDIGSICNPGTHARVIIRWSAKDQEVWP